MVNLLYLLYDEDRRTRPMNFYGQIKLQVEEILRDLAASDSEWRIAILWFFKPVGAYERALIGEDPNGIPNNLMTYIAKVATGELPHLNIFSDDDETKDGTAGHNYIHIVDMA